MPVDLGQAFHYFIPLALCLAGFHGTFFYSEPWKKTASWCCFQAGLTAFLLQLYSNENSLPLVLALMVLAVTLAVGILLAVFCGKLAGKFRVSESPKGSRRGSK